MATSLKTVEYVFPALASMTNNTLTTLTQITLYLPETGTKTFRSVVAKVTMDDIVTATGGSWTTKTMNLRLGAASYTSIANANTLTGGGENASLYLAADFTSHFTTNWSGTSMTCDFQLQVNQSAGTTTGMVNVCVTLEVTYEYDDTSTTQVKTVLIPLDMPATTLPTSATTYDTIPALTTYLPEANKTIRQIAAFVQGNENNASTTDSTITLRIGSASVTTGNHEHALQSDRFIRYVWDVTSAYPDTAATQTWQPTTSVTTRYHHMQAWLMVTYEFKANVTTTTLTEDLDSSETGVDVTSAAALGSAPFVICIEDEEMLVTSIASNTLTVTRGFNGSTAASHSNGATVNPRAMQSLQLPLQVDSPMGGTASTDHQRATRELFIQEPGRINRHKVAFYCFWTQIAAIGGLNMRIGTGSFVAYTDVAAVTCGSNAAMIRNDSAFTLARGRNSMNFDCYRTDTADFGWSVGGFFIVNYSSNVSAKGFSAHNHTVKWGLQQNGTAASAFVYTTSAIAPVIPESDYYINALGLELVQLPSSTANGNMVVFVERLSAEGGQQWESAYLDALQTDPETGAYLFYAQIKSLFKRWPNDPGADRMDLETSRRWRVHYGGLTNVSGWHSLGILMTYHSITYTVSGTVSGSGAGTVDLNLCRASSGERVLSTSRSGNGAFSFTWFDNTEQVFVEAREGASYLGRSDNDVATGSP